MLTHRSSLAEAGFRTVVSGASELDSDRWDNRGGGVFVAGGAPETADCISMAALLRAGPGSVVSHYSALAMWGIPGQHMRPLHIQRMRAANGIKIPRTLVIPHESRKLPPHHVTVHRGFPVVTPARALADVSAREARGRLERWLDWLWSRNLVSHAALDEVVRDLLKRGRRGIPDLRYLNDKRGIDYVPRPAV
ncbi:MAG: hypothetical protein V3V01_18560 [Acidimicrobiales bacterium]